MAETPLTQALHNVHTIRETGQDDISSSHVASTRGDNIANPNPVSGSPVASTPPATTATHPAGSSGAPSGTDPAVASTPLNAATHALPAVDAPPVVAAPPTAAPGGPEPVKMVRAWPFVVSYIAGACTVCYAREDSIGMYRVFINFYRYVRSRIARMNTYD